MLNQSQFTELLHLHGTLILDGALATELENRGHDLKHPLWSGLILQKSPQDICDLHRDYFFAGANIAITASYQTSTQGIEKHLGLNSIEAANLIKQSVNLAIDARQDAQLSSSSPSRRRTMLVAGSVGPYGAYLANGSEYTGMYGAEVDADTLKSFHRPRIQALIDAGVDLLALETMPQKQEIGALLDLLATEFSGSCAWISCSLRDGEHISDDTDISAILRMITEHNRKNNDRATILAFGVNCAPPTTALEAIKYLSNAQQRDPSLSLPLVCYPNSGETWEAQSKTWDQSSQTFDAETLVRECIAAGAKLIGGCCRTGPEFVQTVVRVVDNDIVR